MSDDPALDPVLAALSYESIEMLRLFRQEGSFREVSIRFGRDERTVSRQLTEIDNAFWATKQVHIIDRETHRKTYRLTPAGEIFVSRLEAIANATRDAVDVATSATRRVPVLCTSNCLSYFHTLSEALPSDRTFDIVPLPRRTADIDLSFKAAESEYGHRICLVSALMSSEQHPSVGSITQWTDRIEVLPLEFDAPRLLSSDDLGFRRPVTAREVAEAGVTFLTPPGGPAFEFLNRSYPEWEKLRPFQHIAVPDLDYGLKCLANRLVPRSAMVVHGLDETFPRRYNVDPVHFYDFASNGSHKLLAVTGIFHAREEHGVIDKNDPREIIWQTAVGLWSEKEHVL
jgi:hypothetical protein